MYHPGMLYSFRALTSFGMLLVLMLLLRVYVQALLS